MTDREMQELIDAIPIDSPIYTGPPEEPPSPTKDDSGWMPRLNPSQRKVFDTLAKRVLMYGEKGSGKTAGGIAAMIRHCYEEEDALALIVAPQIRTGKDGTIYDVEWSLDIWRNGNYDPKDPERKRIDDGIGLDFSEPMMDPQTKDRIILVGNRHGGWSKIMLISIPYAAVVEKRMKALSPSFVLVDEITELDSKEFFVYVVQQLGRRRFIKGPQQYMASCNPDGPSHWVYKVFWEEEAIDPETGHRRPDYEVYHVPISENIANLPDGYVEGLQDLYYDPIDRKRLLYGEWVDRPAGDAIFKSYWRPEIHILGEAKSNTGIMPVPGIPMICGYDPGPVNYSVHMMQMVPCRDRTVWLVIDELNFVGKFVPDTVVVPRILERMDYWQKVCGWKMDWVHVADESAFSHRRHDGSYDATRLVQLSNNRIRPRACPKAKEQNSVVQRVNMIITMLLGDNLKVSATCPKTVEMFRMLSSEKPKDGKHNPNLALTPKRSVYLHPFDSLSYPPYYFTLNPSAVMFRTSEIEPQMYSLGRG